MVQNLESREEQLEVRDPSSTYRAVDRLKLAARPANPADARFCLVQTMPPGNGLEAPIEAVAKLLEQRFPEARISRLMRRNVLGDDPAERAEIAEKHDAAIVFLGPAATMVHVGWLYASALERGGLPVAVALFDELQPVADHCASTQAAALRRATMPTTSSPPAALEGFADSAIEALLAPPSVDEQRGGRHEPPRRERIAQRGTWREIQRRFREQGWSDGLPIVPPTDEAVERMLSGTSRARDELVTETLRPEGLSTSVEMVAINAVMAGAEPVHLPVILAAVSLFGDIQLESMTRSVNSFAFSHLLNGPLARELGVVGGLNALAPSTWPNTAIARSIALTVRNCGGQRVGVTATPTQGNAAGISVFAENEDESPWEPFHVSEGFDRDEDTVSLFVGGFATVGNFYYRDLDDAAGVMRLLESNAGVLLMPSAKRARALAGQGLSRDAVADHVWRGATCTLAELRARGTFPMIKAQIERAREAGSPSLWPADYLTRPDSDTVPIYPRSGVKVAVVGSSISSVMQLWNSNLLRTTRITPWR